MLLLLLLVLLCGYATEAMRHALSEML